MGIFTTPEKENLSRLQRLPDTLMGTTAIFVDHWIHLQRAHIFPYQAEEQIQAGYAAFSRILGHFAFYKDEDKYW